VFYLNKSCDNNDVIIVFDELISTLPKSSDFRRKYEEYKEILPRILNVPDNSIIADPEGKRFRRNISYRLANFYKYPGGIEIFRDCCRVLFSSLMFHIDEAKFGLEEYKPFYLLPNVIFSLGGAERISNIFLELFSDLEWVGKQKYSLKCFFLRKVIKEGLLVGFSPDEYDEYFLNSYRERINTDNLYLFPMQAIVVEDFVGKGRSINLAVKYLRENKVNVLGVVSFFSQLEDHWPLDDVPIKITLMKIENLYLVQFV